MNKILRKIRDIVVIIIILFIINNVYFMNATYATTKRVVDIVKAYYDAGENIEDMLENAGDEKISEWANLLGGYSAMNDVEKTEYEQEFIDSMENEGYDGKKAKEVINAIYSANSKIDTEMDEDVEDMMKYKLPDIKSWLMNNPQKIATLKKNFPDVVKKWQEVINNEEDEYQRILTQNLLDGMTLNEAETDADRKVYSGKSDSAIYKYPSRDDKGKNNSEQSLEDMVSDANSFINSGELKLNQDTLSNFSKTMYNILLAIGVVVAVIVGAIIGIKLMTSSIEEKAEAKELLVPYVVGCAVVFGGFGIWKIVVTILQNI